MYVDMFLNEGNYRVTIYRNGLFENLQSKNMELLAKCVASRISCSNKECYIDKRGIGICLTDYLDKFGVAYTSMGHSDFLDLDKIASDKKGSVCQ
ncbi:hypothetical protein AALB39_04020 [Lachnospiraceae bacterium 54-53]